MKILDKSDKEIKETANILIDLIESKNKTAMASLEAG